MEGICLVRVLKKVFIVFSTFLRIFSENLTRRTNYFQCLDDPYGVTLKTRKWNYPLPEFGGIYSRDVYVFRRRFK